MNKIYPNAAGRYLCLSCTRETEEEVPVLLPDFLAVQGEIEIKCTSCGRKLIIIREVHSASASSPRGSTARGFFDSYTSRYPRDEPVAYATEVFVPRRGDLILVNEFSLPEDLKRILKENQKRKRRSWREELKNLKASEEYQFFWAQPDELKREIYSTVDPYEPSGWKNASVRLIVKAVKRYREGD